MKNFGSQEKNGGFAQNVVAVFARAPRVGEVKTRLAKSVGEAYARDIYAAMLREVFASAQRVASQIADGEVVVFYTPQNAFSHDAFARDENSLSGLWNGARYPQSDGDLGMRLHDCFEYLRANGAQNIVAIGSDAPDLPLDYLVQAFDELSRRDWVFGPTGDGGFYLMGASCALTLEVFCDVRWSSENTLQDVLSNADNLSLSRSSLRLWHDVDTIDDLHALHRRLQIGKGVAPHTHRVLDVVLQNEKAPQD